MKLQFNNFHLMVIKQGLICTLNVLKEHASDIPPTSQVFISPYGLSPKVKISHIVTPKLHTSLLVVKRCLSKLSRAYLGIGAKHKNHIFCKIAEILRALSLVDVCLWWEYENKIAIGRIFESYANPRRSRGFALLSRMDLFRRYSGHYELYCFK